jgi:hypothetical protein
MVRLPFDILASGRSDTLTVNRFWMLLGAAAVVGLFARLYYVLVVVRGKITLSGDAETYFLLGKRLATGGGYVRAREAIDIPTAEFPPVYPLLLGALDFVGLTSATGQRLFGVLIGVGTVVVIGLLGSAVAGRTVGVVSAFIAALYPQLITFDGTLMSEGLFAALISVTLLGAVRAMDPSEKAPTKWWVLASVSTGIGILTRTEAVTPAALHTYSRNGLRFSSFRQSRCTIPKGIARLRRQRRRVELVDHSQRPRAGSLPTIHQQQRYGTLWCKLRRRLQRPSNWRMAPRLRA